MTTKARQNNLSKTDEAPMLGDLLVSTRYAFSKAGWVSLLNCAISR